MSSFIYGKVKALLFLFQKKSFSSSSFSNSSTTFLLCHLLLGCTATRSIRPRFTVGLGEGLPVAFIWFPFKVEGDQPKVDTASDGVNEDGPNELGSVPHGEEGTRYDEH